MQILIICSKFPYPFKDGGAIATYQTYKGLSAKADLVHLLSFNTAKHYVSKQEISEVLFPPESYSMVDIETKPNIVKAFLNLIFSTKPYILERFYNKSFVNKLIEKIKNNQFDIIQIEGLYMLQYITVIRSYCSAKIVYRAHNVESDIWKDLASKEKNILKKKYLKLLARRISNYEQLVNNDYDVLIPISKEDAQEYHRLGAEKPTMVIPTGFDFSEQNILEHNPIPKSLCYIGSLDWRPNQEGILWFLDNCWSELRSHYPDLKLYLAGRNAPDWLIQKFLKPGVNWVGEVESSAKFIKNKTIMIVPLQSGSGMRIKIIEGFLLAKAVIATNAAVKGVGAEHDNHLIIADEPKEFIQGILKYLSNAEFLKRISENGYFYGKSRFDNEKILAELYDFYKNQISN